MLVLIKDILVPIDFHSRKTNGSQWGPETVWLLRFFRYLLLCSTEERNSYRFGTTWRWV